MFARKSARNIGVITLATGYIVYDPVTTPTNSSAGIRLNSDGNIETQTGDGAAWVSVGTWKASGDIAANYQSYATVTAGTLSTGNNTTLETLSSTRTWTRTRTSDVPGSDTVEFTLAIFPIGGLSALDTANVTLEAEVGA